MSEIRRVTVNCDGDFKCHYCKTGEGSDPDDKFGACKESEIQDRVDELEEDLCIEKSVSELRGKHRDELEAQIVAVKKCPVYFEGGVMEIAQDGLFPTGGMMSVADVLAALPTKPPRP